MLIHYNFYSVARRFITILFLKSRWFEGELNRNLTHLGRHHGKIRIKLIGIKRNQVFFELIHYYLFTSIRKANNETGWYLTQSTSFSDSCLPWWASCKQRTMSFFKRNTMIHIVLSIITIFNKRTQI